MAFGPSPPRYRPGQHAIRASDANRLIEAVGRMRNTRSIGVNWTPVGVLSRPPDIPHRLAMTGSGGIPARTITTLSSAEVTDYSILQTDTSAATLQGWSTSFTAWNLSQNAVQPNTMIIAKWLWSMWIVIWEDCPPTS